MLYGYGNNRSEGTMAKNNFEYNLAGLAFMGCLFVGIGIGIWRDNTAMGALFGVVPGLIAMSLIIKYKIK
jgi:hypothetical protein